MYLQFIRVCYAHLSAANETQTGCRLCKCLDYNNKNKLKIPIAKNAV